MRFPLFSSLGLVLALAAPAVAVPPSYELVDVLEHPDGLESFGQTLALDGRRLFVAAPLETPTAGGAHGAVYAVDLDGGGGAPMQRIVAPDSSGAFGFALAVVGKKLVVGAPSASPDGRPLGTVHVFRAATGRYERTVANPNPADGGEWGFALATDGRRVLVGAPYPPAPAMTPLVLRALDVASGAVEPVIESPDDGTQTFGSRIAVVDDLVLASNLQLSPARVHVFARATGELLHTLYSPDPERESGFGWSLTPVGKTIVIGAPVSFEGHGAAYVFDPRTGDYLRTLQSPDDAVDQFGQAAAALDARRVVIGSPTQFGTPEGSAAYVFDVTTGAHVGTMRDPAPEGRMFGTAVAAGRGAVFVAGYRPADQHVVLRFAVPCGLPLARAQLTLGALGEPSGDETLRFTGRIVGTMDPTPVPAAVTDAGVELRIADAVEQTVLALTVPGGGGCGPRDGWRLDANRRRAIYRNRSGAFPPGCAPGSARGVERLEVRHHVATGDLGVVLSLAGASIPHATPPLATTISLGGSTCGGEGSELACKRARSGSTLRCAQP
jgi:hypothetical protein